MSYSASLSELLNQTVTLSTFASRNVAGEETYTDSQVSARKEGRRRLVTTADGERLVSPTTVIVQIAVTIEDQIDGRRVLEVLDMVEGDGEIIGYEVLLQ